MNLVSGILLGGVGLFIGSYLNVLGTRFSQKSGFRASRHGRSHCDHCRRELRWYELIPVLSYLLQGARCRSCRKRISLQYPIVELLSAMVFILVPWRLHWEPISILWVLVFLILILIAIIDLRLSIIPDKLNLLLALLGFLIASLIYAGKLFDSSFLGSYALLFQLGEGSFWIHRLAGILAGLIFFGGIYLFSSGKAMGLGDVKFAASLGLLLGWPDIILTLILGFLVGSLFVLPLLATRRKAMKDALPFAPFIAIGMTLVFFFGYHILNGYFQLFKLY